MKQEEKMHLIKSTMEEIEKYPQRLGGTIYYRIGRNERYEMLGIDSDDFYNFMNYKLFEDCGLDLSPRIWKSATSIIKGKYGNSDLKELRNRVAQVNDCYYYDLLNKDSEEFKYVRVNAEGWDIVQECKAKYSWNSFSEEQVIPDKENGDLSPITEFLNLDEEDKLFYSIYLIALFVPDIQYPILNINGEHGTGKSTISWIAKELSDPSLDDKINYRNDAEEFTLSIAENHTTVYDNTEFLHDRMNALFCQSVTGGQVSRRKLYTNSERVLVPLRSAIIINGISSVIKREDLMSRAIFVKTQSNDHFKTAQYKSDSELKKAFRKKKSIFLGGIFNILSKAMSIKPSVHLDKFYRLMDFAEWGYAIAEAMEVGLGEKFLEILDKNEKIQLQETYDSEPLIMLISNYMQSYGGDGICTTTQKFYNDLSAFTYQQLGKVNKKIFPTTVATFSKKVRSYKSIFKKLGWDVDIFQSRDKEHISKISIYPYSEENPQDNVVRDENMAVQRVPITNFRKPILSEKAV